MEHQQPGAKRPQQAIQEPLDKPRIEEAAKCLFAILLELELSEAEAVAAITMTLAMRCAYASKDLEDLTQKISTAESLFAKYARANLSSAMSVIIAKGNDLKGAH